MQFQIEEIQNGFTLKTSKLKNSPNEKRYFKTIPSMIDHIKKVRVAETKTTKTVRSDKNILEMITERTIKNSKKTAKRR